MKSKARNIKERACALVLALILALSGILPEVSLTAKAANGDPIKVVFIVSEGSTGIEGATVTVGSSTAQTDAGGTCEITGLIEGSNYSYTVTKDYYGTESGQFTASTSSVSVKMNKEVTGISLNPTSSTTIEIGGTCLVEALTVPTAGKSCTWNSSQPGVASVENGVVTGISAGSTTITASYGDVTSNSIEVTVTKINTNISLDLQAIPTNKVDAVVKCTVNGLPSDGTGTIVATGTIDFIVNGKKETSVSLPTNSYTISDASGDIKVQAVYSGDNKYYGSSSAIEDAGKFTKSQRIIFEEGQTQEDPKVVTLTTEGTKEFEINYAEASNVQGDLSYQVKKLNASTGLFDEDSDKVTVNNNTVTAEESGFYKIIVTAAAKDDYNEASADYYVYVQEPVDIDEFADTFTTTADKTYDGTGNLDKIIARIPADSLEIYTGNIDLTKPVEFIFKGSVEKKDANIYQKEEITLTKLDKVIGYNAAGNEVDLTNQIVTSNFDGVKLEGTVVINKKQVKLGTSDATVEYAKNGKTVTEQFAEASVEYGTEKKVNVTDDADAKLLENDEINVDTFKATVENEPNGCGYTVGENVTTIKPALSELNSNYTNYEFVSDENSLGSLTVKVASFSIEKIMEIVEFTSDTDVYQDETQVGKVWVRGGTLKAKIRANTSYTKFFDAVVIYNIDENIDLTENGYETKDEDKTYDVTYKIYLSKNRDAQTKSSDITIIVDQTAPGFKFGKLEEGKTIKGVLAQIVTFNKYKRTEFSLNDVEAHDDLSEDSITTVGQSGIREWSYKIYKTNDNIDVTLGDLEKFAENSEVAWTKAKDSTSTIPVAVLDGDVTLADIEGNYIVLVNVIDNVGNQVTLASEGMILDYKSPNVEIKASNGSEINEKMYYSGDVDFKVLFTDETVSSGFKSATIEIFDGDSAEETMTYDFLRDGSYSLSEIAELAKRELTKTPDDKEDLTVRKDYNSNNLKIKVTACDQSGTEPRVVEQNLMIDSKAPEISVEYSCVDDEGNKIEAQNVKYYRAPRTMVITYAEKNFDPDGITFDVAVGSDISIIEPTKGVPLSKLSDYGIKVQSDLVDSQEGRNSSTYNDERTNTLTLVFDVDNEYYILPHCTDLAGNSERTISYSGNDTKTAKTTFVIDQTPPVISQAQYSSEDANFAGASKSEDKPSTAYSNKDVSVKVTIEEKNFSLSNEENNEENKEFSNKQMDFTKTKGEKPDIIRPTCITDAEDANKWSNVVDKHSCVLTFLVGAEKDDVNQLEDKTGEDANYTFGFTYTDLAGNETIYEPEYFTVDNNHPTGEIKIGEVNIWRKVLKILSFGIFKKDEHTVTLTGDDETAGVDEKNGIFYYKSSEYLTFEQFENLKEDDWISGTSFNVKPNEQYVVYEKIVDRARNVTYRYPNNGIVADNKEPIISLADISPKINGLHNGDVTVKVSVEDPIVGDTYSGLKYVWYEIKATGNSTNATPNERTSGYTLLDNSRKAIKDEKNRTYEGNIIVPAKDFNSNDVSVIVHAEDFAGVTNKKEIGMSIDITAPVIENITWNTSAASNGKYYNVTRVATITVRERNFDPNKVSLWINNTDGTPAQVSGWTVDTSGTSDENKNTCTVTFAADGDYNMNVSCTDKAGWNSNTQTVEEFTIDKTAPTINVAFDNNNVKNGKYYNASRTATITVNEHNFRGSDVQTAISSNTSTPGVYGWNGGGDVHTATVPFTTDGAYSFVVNYTDLAGNPAVAYNVNEFVVDLTKPEIEIFDIVDKSANNGEVAPGVRYSDTNYDVNGVSITYSGPKHEEKAVDGARSSIPNGESIKMADFEHTQETDDVYTMVAKVTDLAGNYDEKQVTFSVNRFGSNFIFSDETAEFLDDYYNNEEENLVVTEINVDTLEHRGITCGHDGDMTEFEEGEDYTVKESGSEVSWKSYKYTINKENFEKEGLYNITIDSVDRATNEVNNKIKEADIEFVIDKTAPTVVITGIEDDGQYRTNERDITIATADNVAMDRVEFYVDDSEKPVESYNAQTILRQKGELPYTLTSSSDWQEIKAVAIDKAGNVTDTSRIEGSDSEKWISVLVTSNVFVQFYRNTPVLIGTIVVLILLFAFLFLVLAKRRKKDEGKTA